MHLASVRIAIVSLAVLAACSSTGRLGEYNFNQTRVVFRPIAEARAMTASVWVDDPTPGLTPWTAVASVFLSIVGSAAASDDVSRTINTDGVASMLSEGLEKGMADRYGITTMLEGEGEADFIVETRLRDIELSSDAGGVFLHLKVDQVLLDWNDRSCIYKQGIDQHVALRFNPASMIHPTVATVVGVVSAAQLLAMEDEEIQDAVLATSSDAALMLSDSFINAVARSR